MASLEDELKKWVVNDYFTPNIKAEVILDTLLTPYVDKLVNQQLGLHTVFVTKEMSIYEKPVNDEERQDNRGAKIDYVLADRSTVYLVELKTTKGSIEPEQAERYITHCYGENGKTFGEALGDKLLRIMETSAQKAKIRKPSLEKEMALREAFCQVTGAHSGPYADQARRFLKQRQGTGTDKYLFTMGQLMDYLNTESGMQKAKLWDKPLRLIYITPDGQSPHDKLTECGDFYIHPKDTESIHLRNAVSRLSPEDGGEGYLQMLKEIVEEIYGG